LWYNKKVIYHNFLKGGDMMKTSSNSLTIRGASPLLKRALKLRSERQGTSLEKTAMAILDRELAAEKRAIEHLDQQVTIVS
jgi:hypothetical protein